jgi:hypothetical protein
MTMTLAHTPGASQGPCSPATRPKDLRRQAARPANGSLSPTPVAFIVTSRQGPSPW